MNILAMTRTKLNYQITNLHSLQEVDISTLSQHARDYVNSEIKRVTLNIEYFQEIIHLLEETE